MGSPKHVLARFKRTAEGTVCDYSSLLEYPDAIVCCSASYRSPDSRFSIAVTGEKGRCHVEVRQGNIRYLDLPAGLSEKDLPQSAGTSPANTPFCKMAFGHLRRRGKREQPKRAELTVLRFNAGPARKSVNRQKKPPSSEKYRWYAFRRKTQGTI